MDTWIKAKRCMLVKLHFFKGPKTAKTACDQWAGNPKPTSIHLDFIQTRLSFTEFIHNPHAIPLQASDVN